MKLVREHIEQFIRGKNPFKTLKIGKIVEIENWFKTWAPYADYEIDDNLNIKVKRNLVFYKSNITSLPDNLHIGGYLDLRKTEITFLPNNLHVETNLYMRGTKVTSLPNDLYIGHNLWINYTIITSLPDNLHVGGEIYKDF